MMRSDSEKITADGNESDSSSDSCSDNSSDRKKTYSTQASHKAPKKTFLRKGQGIASSNNIARPDPASSTGRSSSNASSISRTSSSKRAAAASASADMTVTSSPELISKSKPPRSPTKANPNSNCITSSPRRTDPIYQRTTATTTTSPSRKVRSSTIQERTNINPRKVVSSIQSTVQSVKKSATPVVRDLKQKLANQRRGLKKKLICNITKRTLTSQMPQLKSEEEVHWQTLLHAFTTRHQSHHRPLALVSSGGTATDLEVNAVRMLDNFSTGMRGAVSVEQFLKRGYAVIHLTRCGSAAPYSRCLGELLGCRAGNHGLGFEALGRLFEGQSSREEEEELERLAEKGSGNGGDIGLKDDNDDPWLTSSHLPPRTKPSTSSNTATEPKEEDSDEECPTTPTSDNLRASACRMNLHKHILNSTILESKLRERAQVVQDGLLLTVPFRTVEEYLAKLKLCTEAMEDCQSMGLVYLTAAVSDFYIPKAKRALHKIQSRNYDLDTNGNRNGNGEGGSTTRDEEQDATDVIPGIDTSTAELQESGELTLTLYPVPKVIPLIREAWAPHAFCVTFKLETDKAILYDKAKIAMKKYNVHLVIGNLLATRHQQVWFVERGDPPIALTTSEGASSNGEHDSNSDNYTMTEISRASSETKTLDELEDAMISEVVQKHFEYIASHYIDDYDYSGDARSTLPRTALMAGAEAAARHNVYLMEKRKKLQREVQWKRVKELALTAAGHLLGMYLSYSISSTLQKRMKL